MKVNNNNKALLNLDILYYYTLFDTYKWKKEKVKIIRKECSYMMIEQPKKKGIEEIEQLKKKGIEEIDVFNVKQKEILA